MKAFSARHELDKVVIVGESNNAGVWGWNLRPPEANRDSGANPPTLKRLLQHFSKKNAFLSIFWS